VPQPEPTPAAPAAPAAKKAKLKVAKPVATAPNDHGGLQRGDQVVLYGLTSAPELNGRAGQILGWVQQKLRYAVVVEGRDVQLTVKPANLRRAPTCPPPKPSSAPQPNLLRSSPFVRRRRMRADSPFVCARDTVEHARVGAAASRTMRL